MVTFQLWDLFRLIALLHQKWCSEGQVPEIILLGTHTLCAEDLRQLSWKICIDKYTPKKCFVNFSLKQGRYSTWVKLKSLQV